MDGPAGRPTDNPPNSDRLGVYHRTVPELTVQGYWQSGWPIWQQFRLFPDPDPKWLSGTVRNTPSGYIFRTRFWIFQTVLLIRTSEWSGQNWFPQAPGQAEPHQKHHYGDRKGSKTSILQSTGFGRWKRWSPQKQATYFRLSSPSAQHNQRIDHLTTAIDDWSPNSQRLMSYCQDPGRTKENGHHS